MARNRIAEAYVELRAEGATRTTAAIGAVKKELGELKRGGDAALGRIADRMTEATEGAAKLQGAIGSVIGVVVALAAVMFKLGSAIFNVSQSLRDGAEKARDFADTLGDRSIENAPERLAAIRAEQDKLNALLADDSVFGFFEKVFAGGEDNIRRQRDELSRFGQTVADQIAAATARASDERERQAQALAETAQAENDALRAAQLRARAAGEVTDQERARLELQALSLDRQAEIIANIQAIANAEAEENAALADALRERAQIQEEIYNGEARRIRQNRDAAIKAEEEKGEAARQIARETAAANAAAIADLQQQTTNALDAIAGSQSQTFSRIADAVDRAVNKLERIERYSR